MKRTSEKAEKPMMFLRTLIVWAIGLPLTFAAFAVIVLMLPFDRRRNAAHSIGALWSRLILSLSGVSVRVRGLENVPKGPVIFISNHRGAFDIPVLQAYLPVQFRWVAKKSLFKIPLVGWVMSLAGYISIDRENAQSAFKSMAEAAEKIRSGTSVLIFPEGTRSSTDELLPFKRGSFFMAARSGAPVVPVAVTGTRDIMKRGSLSVRPGNVTVTIGRPMATSGLDEKTIRAEARKAVEGLLLKGA